jgi:myo-inositol-1(or 4)-monophosphatase
MKQNMKLTRESATAFSENGHLNIMERMARRSAKPFNLAFGDIERKLVTKEGAKELATETISRMERFYHQDITEKAPDEALVFSSDDTLPSTGSAWLVNTCGSAINLMHGAEPVNLSFLHLVDGEAQCALVYYPLTDEIFAIEKGKGAFSQERRLRVSGIDTIDNGLISIFSPVSQTKDEDAYINLLKTARQKSCHVRTSGNLIHDTLQLCQGKLDAIVSINQNPVDLFISQFIIRESGGYVCELNSKPIELGSTQILGANSKLQGKWLKLLANK